MIWFVLQTAHDEAKEALAGHLPALHHIVPHLQDQDIAQLPEILPACTH